MPVKKEVKKLVDKTYRMADDQSGESFMLKVGRSRSLLVFDESEKRNRAIRHCPNERSIFVEDQSEHALVEPIIFLTGYLEVPHTDVVTQQFLDAHPSNVKNGGNWFEEVNDEIEAEQAIAMDEIIMDIKQAIRDKSKEKGGLITLSAIVATISGSVVEANKLGLQELKRKLYLEAERDPMYFVDDNMEVNIFDNDYIYRKYLVLNSIKQGLLKKSKNGKAILWAKEGKVIATAPQSVDTIEFFTNYLTTDDGLLVSDELKARS